MKSSLLAFFILMTNTIPAQDFPFEQLRKNLISGYLMEDERTIELKKIAGTIPVNLGAGDITKTELNHKKQDDLNQAQKYIREMNADGSWNDINYKDQGRSNWGPAVHSSRIYFLSKIYISKESPLFKDKSLSEVLHKSLNFWFSTKLVCPNWWFNEIGVPMTFGRVFIMLKDELSEAEIIGAVEVMDKARFRMTGQNKVWLAGNIFLKALLTEDEKLARRARDTIVSEIRTGSAEGIQADFSFHQHGPQQQFGNYGLAFVNSMVSWARIFANTSLEINTDQKEIMHKLLSEGYNWICWKGYMDVNSLGRQVFKNAQRSKALSLAYSMMDMSIIDPANQNIYQDFIKRNIAGREEPNFTGNKHFWNSDLTINRAPSWYASVKLSSPRVIGIESGNGENLKGYYLADGATYIYVNGDEYLDIFPIWNWRKLPGVSCYLSNEPLKQLSWQGYRNGSDFTGGISNGKDGITAINLLRDSLSARKAWFFFDNLMICLGAGISTTKNLEITTTLNQCHLKGAVSYFDGKEKAIKQEFVKQSGSIKWIYHNNIGYYLLQPSDIEISAISQKGDWHEIAGMYGSETVSGDVFTLSISHGIKPENGSYAYAILPAVSKDIMKNFNPQFEIIRNDSKCQLITDTDKSRIMLVIYEPCDLQIAGTGNFSFSQAGIFMFEKQNGTWNVHLADPTHKLNRIAFSLNNIKYDFEIPKGTESGKTMHKIL